MRKHYFWITWKRAERYLSFLEILRMRHRTWMKYWKNMVCRKQMVTLRICREATRATTIISFLRSQQQMIWPIIWNQRWYWWSMHTVWLQQIRQEIRSQQRHLCRHPIILMPWQRISRKKEPIHWEQSQPSRSHPTIRPTAVLPKTARLMRQRPAVWQWFLLKAWSIRRLQIRIQHWRTWTCSWTRWQRTLTRQRT